jgi:hypothetical protein
MIPIYGCSIRPTPESYPIVEVLLQTGAVLGTDGCSSTTASRQQILDRDQLWCESRMLACRAGLGAVLVGGIDVVVQARPHGGNVSEVSSPGALNIDRRRVGRWDREQLIGGKAIEPRK